MVWIRSAVVTVLVLVAAGATGVGVASATSTPVTSSAPPPATVWLCRPGQADDPCTPSLATTRTTPSGRVLGVSTPVAPARPPIDCFYVYPTVSDQKTPNADLTVDPTERSIALYQAARFSSVCRVYAPMYRQLTLTTIGGAVTAAESAIAYADVKAAWLSYLHHDNHGRGVVLIGHSQGSFLLRQLIATQIDPDPSVRHLLVSAVLPGGNVLVKTGSDVGGDFHHIPACRSASEVGCVIAYSTFDAVPPAGSLFGRTTATDRSVLCTNPAALAGGSGELDPILPTQPFAPGSTIADGIDLLGYSTPAVGTPWVSVPGAYTARCSSANGANVLEITPLHGAPLIHYSPTPGWGLHLVDVNLALGNLITVVQREAAAYQTAR